MSGLTVPITERLMKKKRGDLFLEYEKRTNKFLPF
jgi:steroid 5-alpha reductase family enzyme